MSYQKVIITRYGGPEVLRVSTESQLPIPQSGEVRLKMLATSASFTDILIRKGRYYGIKQKPPFSPGYDVAGMVNELGAGVTSLQKGQRVAGLTVTGGILNFCAFLPQVVFLCQTILTRLKWSVLY